MDQRFESDVTRYIEALDSTLQPIQDELTRRQAILTGLEEYLGKVERATTLKELNQLKQSLPEVSIKEVQEAPMPRVANPVQRLENYLRVAKVYDRSVALSARRQKPRPASTSQLSTPTTPLGWNTSQISLSTSPSRGKTRSSRGMFLTKLRKK